MSRQGVEGKTKNRRSYSPKGETGSKTERPGEVAELKGTRKYEVRNSEAWRYTEERGGYTGSPLGSLFWKVMSWERRMSPP